MKIAVAGDALIQRRIPANYPGAQGIKDWLAEADARYFNLETTIFREYETQWGGSMNGGSYLRADPEVLLDLMDYGFNMTSFVNNHSLDYDIPGLIKTMEYVTESGLIHAGCGMNLDQAAAPAYLELDNGRVALIAFTASMNTEFQNVGMAGRQSRRVPGRPGPNQLRIHETLIVTEKQMEALKEIEEQTGVNGALNISRAEGYTLPAKEGTLDYGKHTHFRVGDVPHKETVCEQKDLQRLEDNIRQARFQSDFIMVGIHAHQLEGTSKENPAAFLQEFAHHAIDCGADAVVGHGPHLLRPMEIYKGKPIFYSLGDFIMHNENVPYSPEDAYEKYSFSSNDMMHDMLKARTKGFTVGLMSTPKMMETVIPRWETDDETGKITKLELLAVDLGLGQHKGKAGNPRPAANSAILERYAEMSAPYGVKMTINGNIATVEI